MLSLLGTCYNPMKQFRQFSIHLSDGVHSLKRISDYLDLPETKLPTHEALYRNIA